MVSSPKKADSLSCWPKGSSDGLGWNVCLGGGVWGRLAGGGALVLNLCRGNCSSDQVESVSGTCTAGAAERGRSTAWTVKTDILYWEASLVHTGH